MAAGARGPLDEAGVADQGVGIEVAFDGPGDDFFAAGLANDVEGDEVAVDGERRFLPGIRGGRRREALRRVRTRLWGWTRRLFWPRRGRRDG